MNNFDATMIVEGQWELTDYEESEEIFIEACQHLIDTGLAWTLQGYFGRICSDMISNGICTN
jgi:hypothetical protein